MDYRIGIDVGSTTVKVVVLSPENELLSAAMSGICPVREKTCELLKRAQPVVDGHPSA